MCITHIIYIHLLTLYIYILFTCCVSFPDIHPMISIRYHCIHLLQRQRHRAPPPPPPPPTTQSVHVHTHTVYIHRTRHPLIIYLFRLAFLLFFTSLFSSSSQSKRSYINCILISTLFTFKV